MKHAGYSEDKFCERFTVDIIEITEDIPMLCSCKLMKYHSSWEALKRALKSEGGVEDPAAWWGKKKLP